MSFETKPRKDSQSHAQPSNEIYGLANQETEKTRSKKGKVAVIGLVAGALVAGGGFLGVKAMGSDNEAPVTDPNPTAEAPAVPGETPATPVESAEPTPDTVVEAEPTVESLQLSAELPAEELAQQAIDRLNEWRFADATESTVAPVAQAWLDYDGGMDVFLHDVAEENAQLYSAALFAENWQSNPMMVETYDNYVSSNADFIGAAVTRHLLEEENQEDMPLVSMTTKVENVQEFSSVAEMDPADITPLWEVVKEQINLGNARVITYTATPTFENWPEGDDSPSHIVQVFDITTGTARLLTQTAVPVQ